MSLNLGPLFEAFELKSLRLRNRVAMAPMTRNFSPDGVPGPDVCNYYRRRAEGGVGLLITEGTVVNHPGSNGYENVPFFYGREPLEGWKRVVDAVHGAGGAVVPQLWHVGAVRRPGVGPVPEEPGYSPSGLYAPGKPNGKAMTQQDIHEVIAAFARAAWDARRLGFDGVEIHAAHGYLLDQFLWEGTNQRDDAYGGSLLKRARFVVEIVEAVRQAVGEDFAIMLRFSQWKQQDYEARLANTPQELEELLLPLVEAGVDMFHASTRRFWEPEFPGSDLNLAGWTRKIAGQPTMSVGSVGLSDDFISSVFQGRKEPVEHAGIEELLWRMENREFDMVAVGRALLQDPEWLRKLREGRTDEIRPFVRTSLKTLA